MKPFKDPIEFSRILSNLKRQGSTLLVIGSVPQTVYTSCCRRMMGDTAAHIRYRLFVFTDKEPSSIPPRDPELTSPTDSEKVKVINHMVNPRSTTNASMHPDQQDDFIVNVDSTDLKTLRTRITDAIAGFQQDSGGLDPAQLRLCFDSLLSILSDYEDEDILRLLYQLRNHIREVSGMGHFHLPVECGSGKVDFIVPVFDAVVELRLRDEQLEERWHIPEKEGSSNWITRDDPR